MRPLVWTKHLLQMGPIEMLDFLHKHVHGMSHSSCLPVNISEGRQTIVADLEAAGPCLLMPAKQGCLEAIVALMSYKLQPSANAYARVKVLRSHAMDCCLERSIVSIRFCMQKTRWCACHSRPLLHCCRPSFVCHHQLTALFMRPQAWAPAMLQLPRLPLTA